VSDGGGPLAGRGALVTGVSRRDGIGYAVVRRLRELGADVTIADVNAERGEALAGELGAAFAACDVREEEQVQAAVDLAAGRDGGLRICVVCAGTGWAQKIAGSKGAHPLMPFEVIIAINLVGTFNAWRLAATRMIGNDADEAGERGVLVGTASIAAYDGQIGQVAYAASKGGVVGMTLPVARDLAQYGIRVNTIAPGLFDTPLLAALPEENRAALGQTIPFPKRLGLPTEYARLAVHIAENVMLNGETIRLDGALRMAPK
jgi:NAD(P)-dependent dehydrogenase (short-subunit alcohol dehydrogenase family)